MAKKKEISNQRMGNEYPEKDMVELTSDGKIDIGTNVTKENASTGNIGFGGETPSESLVINVDGNLGLADLNPTQILHVTGNISKLVLDIIPETLDLIDSIQTIERGKIDTIKECIAEGHTLEAIVLLKQLQTGEQWKIEHIVNSLS